MRFNSHFSPVLHSVPPSLSINKVAQVYDFEQLHQLDIVVSFSKSILACIRVNDLVTESA